MGGGFERYVKGGGFNWAMRIAARESQVAVSCFWAATQISSRSGPAGRDIKVMSLGKDVIDLNRSLRVYEV